MNLWFERWDAENANPIGTYDTQDPALATVRSSLDTCGPVSVDPLVLTAESEGGEPRQIAVGADLAELALSSLVPIVPVAGSR